jgi:predicted DNA-binding ribbon-helix-helix protein
MAMVRKTMRVEARATTTTLEPEFWAYLAELAAERGVSVAAVVREAAAARPAGANLASALRTFALTQAQARRRREAPPAGRRA